LLLSTYINILVGQRSREPCRRQESRFELTLMRSESTMHVANPLEPAAPQAAAARLAAPGEAKA
jgi:hypothetical protein